jgi:glycosyltransferase involved in cell wall biosynthesis
LVNVVEKIQVVMPAYNAAKTIKSVYERLPPEAVAAVDKFIVVDDGSADNTQEVVAELLKKYRIELIAHEKNRGYGGAQKTGYNRAKELGADIVVLLHSDGQYAPELLLEMVKPVREGKADIVGGSRIKGGKALEGGMPLLKYVGNRFLTALENLVFGMDVTTYHSGYKVYSRKALEKIGYMRYSDNFYFDSEMYVGAKRNGLRIAEVPIPTRYAGEKSYLNPWTYGLGVLGVIYRYLIGRI